MAAPAAKPRTTLPRPRRHRHRPRPPAGDRQPSAGVRRARSVWHRASVRLPHTLIEHQRRLRFLEPPQKTSRQVCSAQDFSRTTGRRVVGPGMPGRYGSAVRLFGWGAMPSGAGPVGLLAEFAGMRAACGVFGVAAPPAVVPFLRVVAREALAAVPDPR